MKKILIVLLFIFASNLAEAQFIKNKSVNAQIGYGMSMPYNSDADIGDDGFFLQGEYVLAVTSWFELRPYAGFIFTNSNGKDLDDNPTDEKAESKALLIGGKVRLRAPIPWVAPYLESGLGGSIGKFETFTAYTNINKSGFIFHIPFSFGLELGRNHDVQLSYNFYFQPAVEQLAGASSLGLSIPLRNKKK
jgi:hypothetical protein